MCTLCAPVHPCTVQVSFHDLAQVVPLPSGAHNQILSVSSSGEWHNLDKIMEHHLYRAAVHRSAQGVHKVHISPNFFVC